jgi:hypothetical protein
MARLVPDDRQIDLKAIATTLAKLAVLTAAELADAIEIPEARARVLPAGVAIVSAIAKKVRPNRVEIAQSGVRAGLLIEAFDGVQAGAPATEVSTPNVAPIESPPGDPISEAGENSGSSQPAEPDFRETMKALIAEGWANVWRTIPAALDGTDIEGVHDVRVASRRLRAAMDIAAPIFPRRW